MVAAFVHALIDELVNLLLPDGLGQGRTAVLHKALYGTRKASRLWQRFLRDVLADADWKASVIFASVYTLGDQRGTLGCWGDDLLVEADEEDLDAVEARLMKRLEVKVLVWIGGKRSGEVWVPEASVAVRRRDWELLLVQWEALRAGCCLYSSAHRAEPRVQDGRHSWHERHWCDSVRQRRHCRLPERTGISDECGSGQA